MTSKLLNRPPRTSCASNAKVKLIVVALMLGFLIPFIARATVLQDDFAYAQTNSAGGFVGISGANGGSGWGANSTNAWNVATSGRASVSTNQITYTSGGYAIAQVPYNNGGNFTNYGTCYGGFNLYRGAIRFPVTPLTNVVWFSAIMNVRGDNTNTCYIGFNSSQSASLYYQPSTAYSVGLSNNTALVRYGANGSGVWSETTAVANSLNVNATHLILGRITFLSSGVNSELKVWVDPADLTQLGAAQFTQATHNIGGNLFNVCIGGSNTNGTQGTTGGLVAALRFSDGSGSSAQAYTDVTGTTNLAALPPTVTISPAVPVVGNGGNITLTATSGTGTVSNWAFNGVPIAGATSTTLNLTGVGYTNRGFYTVTVTNAAGSGSSTASLEVTNCNLSLVWKGGAAYGGGASTWDTATTNWTLLSNPSTVVAFGGGDTVIFNDSSAVTSVSLGGAMRPGGILFSNSATYSLASGSITGSGMLEMDGSGEVDLLLPCTYTGNTVINGSLALIRAIPGQFQAPNVIFNGTNLTQFAFQSGSGTVLANFSGTNINSHVTAASGLGGFSATLSGNLSHAGDLRVNSGTVVLTGSNSYSGPTMVGNTQNPALRPKLVVGSVNAIPFRTNSYEVLVNANPTQTGTGVNQSGTLDLNGYSITINGLRGNSGSDVFGLNGVITNSGGNATLTLGYNSISDDYEGDIVTNVALVKIGTGMQTLGSANLSYTGSTVVSNGILVINGTLNPSLNSGPAIDIWGGRLGGIGNIYAPITVHPQGTLAPATPQSIGTLAVYGNVTNNGTLLLKINKDTNLGLQNDQLNFAAPSSTLALGGTVFAQSVSTNVFSVSDSFTLFTASGSITGTFVSTNLPYNYSWDTSQLNNNGIITVSATGILPPQPTMLPVYQSGTNLAIGVGTVYGAQYILLGATNLNTPVVWTPVLTNTGTGGSITNLIPIIPGVGQEFYRYQAQ